MFLKRLLDNHRSIDLQIGREPSLPMGASGIASHRSSFCPTEIVNAKSVRYIPITPGETYRDFVKKNSDELFLDAAVLDAFIDYGVSKKMAWGKLIERFWGNFSGQLFFLNTRFESIEGEAVAFLNWRTSLPASRYVCPIDNPVRDDIPVYAAVRTT